jgi:hypothetical protein
MALAVRGHIRMPVFYDPAADATLIFRLDATDSSTILNTSGGAITNGATVGTWSTKAGVARSFTQWGSNGRPTYDATGISGLPALRFSTQLLTTQTTMATFASMSGLTVMLAAKKASGVSGIGVGFTMLDIGTGMRDIVLVQANLGTSYAGGGRRARGNSFQSVVGNVTPTVFVETLTFNFSGAKQSLHESGVEGPQGQTFQTAGTTDPADPYALSVGAFAQESFIGAATFADGWLGEILMWLTAKSSDDLVEPHTYLRLKWGGGTL